MIIDQTSGDSELDELRRQVKQAEIEQEKRLLKKRLDELVKESELERYRAESLPRVNQPSTVYEKPNNIYRAQSANQTSPSPGQLAGRLFKI